MDFEYREVFLRNAKDKAAKNTKMLATMAKEQGIHLISETRDHLTVHSQQIPPNINMKLNANGEVDLASLGPSMLPNVVYIGADTSADPTTKPEPKCAISQTEQLVAIPVSNSAPISERKLNQFHEHDMANVTYKAAQENVVVSGDVNEPAVSNMFNEGSTSVTLTSKTRQHENQLTSNVEKHKVVKTPEISPGVATVASKKRKVDEDLVEHELPNSKRVKTSGDDGCAEKQTGEVDEEKLAQIPPLMAATTAKSSYESLGNEDKPAHVVIKPKPAQAPSVVAGNTTAKKRKIDDDVEERQTEPKKAKTVNDLDTIKASETMKCVRSTSPTVNRHNEVEKKPQKANNADIIQSTEIIRENSAVADLTTQKLQITKQQQMVTEEATETTEHPKAVPLPRTPDEKTLTVTGRRLEKPRFPKKSEQLQKADQVSGSPKPTLKVDPKHELSQDTKSKSTAFTPALECSEKRNFPGSNAGSSATCNSKPGRNKPDQQHSTQQRQQNTGGTAQKSFSRPPRLYALGGFREAGLVNTSRHASGRGGNQGNGPKNRRRM